MGWFKHGPLIFVKFHPLSVKSPSQIVPNNYAVDIDFDQIPLQGTGPSLTDLLFAIQNEKKISNAESRRPRSSKPRNCDSTYRNLG